jgi:hypothetical protein
MVINFSHVKFAAHVASTIGVGKVIKDVISNNVTVVSGIDKAAVTVGTIVLGGVVTEAASRYLTNTFDMMESSWFEMRESSKAAQEARVVKNNRESKGAKESKNAKENKTEEN